MSDEEEHSESEFYYPDEYEFLDNCDLTETNRWRSITLKIWKLLMQKLKQASPKARVPYNKKLTNRACSGCTAGYWSSRWRQYGPSEGLYSPVRPLRSVSKEKVLKKCQYLEIFLLTLSAYFFQFKWQAIIRPRYLIWAICSTGLPEILKLIFCFSLWGVGGLQN